MIMHGLRALSDYSTFLPPQNHRGPPAIICSKYPKREGWPYELPAPALVLFSYPVTQHHDAPFLWAAIMQPTRRTLKNRPLGDKLAATNEVLDILPQEILLGSGETTTIQELLWISGEPVVPILPFMLFAKKVTGRLPIAEWLYRLATFVCCPYELLTLRLQDSYAYLIINVPVNWTLASSASSYEPGRCETCMCSIPQGEEVTLEEGEYGTYAWGIAHKDDDIAEQVAWSGDNHFCRACFVLQAHIAFVLPMDNERRLNMTRGNRSLSLWLAALDAAYDMSEGAS